MLALRAKQVGRAGEQRRQRESAAASLLLYAWQYPRNNDDPTRARNALYAYAIMPVGGWSGAGLFVLVSLWACLRSERG